MKKTCSVIWLLLFALTLSSCRQVDLAGFIYSSDVDRRFEESAPLPAPPDLNIPPGKFSFLVLSDPHVQHGSHSRLEALKQQIQPNDKLILLCGDLVQSGQAADYAALERYLQETGLPYYTALGNHDLYFGGWRHYRTYLGRSHYSFKAGPIRFVCLDTANGTLGAKQRVWLEETLEAVTEDLCFVYTHIAFFSPSFLVDQYPNPEEIYYLMHLFEQTGVSYVFMGHTHRFLHKIINGINYISLPDFKDEGVEKGFIRVFVDGPVVSYEKLSL